MFIEGSFSWDKEAERTSLEWPPLMSPDVAAGPSRGEPADEIVLGIDPDLTAAEVQARCIDSLVDAAFFAQDPAPPARGGQEEEGAIPGRHLAEDPRALGEVRSCDAEMAAIDADATPFDRDRTDQLAEADEAEDDDWDRPPRRRLSASKGPLIALATAVTVALSGGYAAQAFGWRLPPTLRESAQPMRAFLRNLTPSYLMSLMPARVRSARLLPSDNHERIASAPELARPTKPAAASRAGSTPIPSDDPIPFEPVPSEGEASMAAVPPSQVIDPGDTQPRVEREAPDQEPIPSSTTLATGASGQAEQPMERRAAPLWTLAPSSGPAASESAGLPVATRAVPLSTNRDHLPRAWHGLVWSPAAHALVPAVRAVQDQVFRHPASPQLRARTRQVT